MRLHDFNVSSIKTANKEQFIIIIIIFFLAFYGRRKQETGVERETPAKVSRLHSPEKKAKEKLTPTMRYAQMV